MNTPNKKVIYGIVGAAALGTALYVLLGPGKATQFKQKFSTGFDDIACRLSDLFTRSKHELKTA